LARKAALDERLARLATDERLWPTVARLRTFRGIDTLTALCLHLELGGDWRRFRSPRRLDEVGPAREADLEVLMRLGGRVLLSPLTLWPWRSIFRG
jgi:hypothetical protein